MKKNIFTLAALAAAFVSCETEPVNPETPTGGIPEGYVEVKFSAACTVKRIVSERAGYLLYFSRPSI